jgi:hypothetical protein
VDVLYPSKHLLENRNILSSIEWKRSLADKISQSLTQDVLHLDHNIQRDKAFAFLKKIDHRGLIIEIA